MHDLIPRLLRRVAGTVCLAFFGFGPAHAGLVSGVWDPPFGSFLPNLSYQVRANFIVPNRCPNQDDGIYDTTPGGLCDRAGITVQNVWLRLFNAALVVDPNNFFGFDPNSTVVDMDAAPGTGYGISKVRVESGQVVGIEAGRIDFIYNTTPVVLTPVYLQTYIGGPTPFSIPPAAEGNLFGLTLDVFGPNLECRECKSTLNGPNGTNVLGSRNGLTQFLITYTSDDTSAPKFTDGSGNALGARLDSAGVFLGQSTAVNAPLVGTVATPGSLALALAALAAATSVRRRRG